MNAILLYPKDYAQFRLGEGSLDETSELLHSDTFFSALANIYALAFEKADTFVQFVETGKLKFSSGLFGLELVKEQKKIFFVPKPELNYQTDDRKKIKRVKYVSLGALKIISSMMEPQTLSININIDAFYDIGGSFLLDSKERAGYNLKSESFLHIQTSPKVFVRKEVKEDNFYHESNLQFLPIQSDKGEILARGFFYVLFEHSLSESELQEFQAAVRILADEGIGGSRSTGCGHIDKVAFEQINIDTKGHLHLGLSLVSPKNDEEFKAAIQYNLVIRGGGSLGEYGDYKKHRKRACFIREGVIFSSAVQGKLVDVSPDENALPHKILRNGINFSIPF